MNNPFYRYPFVNTHTYFWPPFANKLQTSCYQYFPSLLISYGYFALICDMDIFSSYAYWPPVFLLLSVCRVFLCLMCQCHSSVFVESCLLLNDEDVFTDFYGGVLDKLLKFSLGCLHL